jgi:hypothetical protein
MTHPKRELESVVRQRSAETNFGDSVFLTELPAIRRLRPF